MYIDPSKVKGVIRDFRYLKEWPDYRIFHRKIIWMQKVNRRMVNLLDRLADGSIPNESDYTVETLKRFCKSLVRRQRPELPGVKAGSWCLTPDGADMPSDARVEFIYFPSYLAVSILTRVHMDHPEISESIPGYMDALRNGLRFSTYRGLMGHGFDRYDEMLMTLKFFEKGRVIEFLRSDPDFCPEMVELLRNIRDFMKNALKNRKTKSPWGIDLRNSYRWAVELLQDL
jgi:hypothetical protein